MVFPVGSLVICTTRLDGLECLMAVPFLTQQYRHFVLWPFLAVLAAFTVTHASAVTLAWDPSRETNIAGYRVYSGEVNVPATMVNVGNTTSRSFTTLSPGKSYFFYVTAYNTAGAESAPSSTLVYTVPVPVTAPSAPSNLAATADSTSQVRLSWRDNSTNEVGFHLLRKAGAAGTYTALSVGANSTSYTDSALNAGTQYFYKIHAYNSAGNSADSPEISVTTLSSASTSTNSFPAVTATASFVQNDTLTTGNWVGFYGSEGALAAYGDFLTPTNCQINAYHNYPATWANPTTDTRALQKRTATTRFATRWQDTNTTMFFYLQFKDTRKHRVSFYFLDFDNGGRQEKVEFFDYVSGQFLAATTISNFQNGIYSTWNLQGRITVKFTKLAGPTVLLAGLFFDPEAVSNSPVQMVGADTATSGTWKGKYGMQGHSIATETASVPAYASLSFSGASVWTWMYSTSDATALQRPYVADRNASTWYAANSFNLNFNFTDAAFHRVALYFLDFDGAGRTQRVEVLDSNTGAVLDSTELTQFRSGIWLRYDLKGNVTLRVTRVAGPNAVMSAVFFDQTELQL
jgi:hypothetical protein